MQTKYVIAQLPKAGLGNKLFVWAKAYLHAKNNKINLLTFGLNDFSIGPILRRENVKRFYLGQFKTNSFSSFFHSKLLSYFDTSRITRFDEIPHWSNYFETIRDQRTMVIEGFSNLLSRSTSKELAQVNIYPEIGVHVRLGDFKALQQGTDFKNVGATRTPFDYFITTISRLRNHLGENLKVSIFSDGYAHELSSLLQLNNVEYVSPRKDVIDLLLLSRSKYIITSAGSSFSEWAGFLSNAPIILHPDHIHGRIRIEKNLFEGSIEDFIKT